MVGRLVQIDSQSVQTSEEMVVREMGGGIPGFDRALHALHEGDEYMNAELQTLRLNTAFMPTASCPLPRSRATVLTLDVAGKSVR